MSQNNTVQIDPTAGMEADLTKGLTMEIPYKAFANPNMLWGIIRRNIAVGVPLRSLKLGNVTEVSANLVRVLNEFVDRAAFNAKGLVHDAQEPTDEVYAEFCKSLKFYLTVIDGAGDQAGTIKVDLGIQSKDPWNGLRVTTQSTFWITFLANLNPDSQTDFIYALNAHLTNPGPQTTGYPVKVGAEEIWTHESSFATGQIPSLIKLTDLETQFDGILANLIKKFPHLAKENSDSLVPVMQQANAAFRNFAEWSGCAGQHGSVMLRQASIFVRALPVLGAFGGQGVAYKYLFNVAALGDFSLNVNFVVE